MDTRAPGQPEQGGGLSDYHRHCLEFRIGECDDAVAGAVRSVREAESWEPGDASLHAL